MNEKIRFVLLMLLLLLSVALIWYVRSGIDNNFVDTLR